MGLSNLANAHHHVPSTLSWILVFCGLVVYIIHIIHTYIQIYIYICYIYICIYIYTVFIFDLKHMILNGLGKPAFVWKNILLYPRVNLNVSLQELVKHKMQFQDTLFLDGLNSPFRFPCQTSHSFGSLLKQHILDPWCFARQTVFKKIVG